MRVLLIGEYNRSHFYLKKGLEELGHHATVVGLNDGFKKVSVDISIQKKYDSGIKKKIKVAIHKLLGIDLHSLNILKQLKKNHQVLSNYDIVQYVNESPFLCTPKIEIKIFNFLKQHNKNIFLLSCGTDHISVKYALDKKFRYSILTPYLNGQISKKEMQPALKYLTPSFKGLHNHIYKNIKGVIASDIDYHLPLKNHSMYLGMVPNPIKLSNFEYSPMKIDNDKIVIFHGINKNNYLHKGNNLFDLALEVIEAKYHDKIEIIRVSNLPYSEYIKSFDKAHILLDQVYAYDQGFNALEAMAKGKVVFTGAEQEWLKYYSLKENSVAINALPDVSKIVSQLEWLILNPNKLLEISQNARNFIKEHHNHINVTKEYLNKWTSRL